MTQIEWRGSLYMQNQGRPVVKSWAVAAVLIGIVLVPGTAAADSATARREVERFVQIQNAHDMDGLKAVLLDAPDMLWITRGATVWGREAALQRFAALYRGTWKLDPEYAGLTAVDLGTDAMAIFLPITFTIGAPGVEAATTRFLMNMVLVRTANAWRVSSILPIPAPVQ